MKVTTAHQVLKAFRNTTVRTTSDMLVHKVATRWVVANMDQEYDLMIRTQVLEGLAHAEDEPVLAGIWSNKPRQGIAKAQRFFTDRFPDNQILPEWWDTNSIETIMALVASTKQTLKRFRIHMDPYEFIDSVLMGLSADPTKPAERRRPAYQLGMKDQSHHHIMNGEIGPKAVAQTGLSKAIFYRISDYHDRLKKETAIPVDEKGVVMDVQDENDRGVSAENFMSSLMFGPTDDPLARKVQEVMKTSWPEDSIIDKWFGTIQMTGEVPQANDFANQVGIAPQTLGQRHLKPGLERAVKAIWNNVPLRKAIEDLMIQVGARGDLPATLVEITKRPDHIKVATSYRLRSILASYSAWLIGRAGTKIR